MPEKSHSSPKGVSPRSSPSFSISSTSGTEVVGHELLTGLTQLLILLLLRRGPQHGYELTSLLEPVYGRRLSPGTIYPLLQRMERKEYILSHSLVVAGRKRRTYVLTRLGRVALENALSALRCIVAGLPLELSPVEPGFELLKSLAQYRILSILNRSPLHGYELVEQLASFFGQKIALGTIYPSLHRLAEKGYILSLSKFDGERERKIYELTAFGKKALKHAHVKLIALSEGKLFT